MATILSHYLDNIRDNLRLTLPAEREVIDELETHIEDKFQELKETGLSEEEAANTCVRLLGSAKMVARQIYEAHSQGSWRQVLISTMPPLLFGLIFALNWWRGIGSLLIVLILISSTVIYGWWHGKPSWLFPWLGYSLLPVTVAGLLLLYLPKGWSWLAIVFYVPLAAWLVYAITVQTIKGDWLYSSLMLLPIPIIAGWFIAMGLEEGFPELGPKLLYAFAPWVGLSFLMLATAVAVFTRLRKRWVKVAVLLIAGILTLTVIAWYVWGSISLLKLLLLILLVLSILLFPAFLERRIRHRRQQTTA
jgi:hypothetical protein